MSEFSSTYIVSTVFNGYTGHLDNNGGGLRDNIYNNPSSVWGSNPSSNGFIKADIGSISKVNHVDIANIDSSFDGWGPSYINGSLLQVSTDDSNWVDIATINNHTDNVLKNYIVNSVCRYVRIFRKTHGYLGVGDFKINYDIIVVPPVPPTPPVLDGLVVDSTGFRGVPQNSKSLNYTFVASDSGKHIYNPDSNNMDIIWTIPSNTSVAFQPGTVITLVNDSNFNTIINIDTDILLFANNGIVNSLKLSPSCLATIMKIKDNKWIINGVGLTILS